MIPRALAPLALAGCLAAAAAAHATLIPDWTERWASADGRMDQAIDAVVDADGNVYVCGSSAFGQLSSSDLVTLSYAPDGSLRWLDTFDSGGQDLAAALELDPTGRLVVVGRSLGDFQVLVYDPATGARLGTFHHDPGGIDDPRAVATDAQGHIYVTGSSWTDEQNDYYTIELDADGNLQWSARYRGPGAFLFAHDLANAIAVDAAGDVFVTGTSNAPGSASGDFLTIKYSGVDGSQLWLDRYSGGTNEAALDLELDAQGDVYVTGGSYQSGFVYVTRKYANADGALLWSALDQPELCSFATDLDLDGRGSVFVTGWADPDCDESNFNDNIVTIRYDATTGAKAWTTSFGENGVGQLDVPSDLVVDSYGQPWVTGESLGELILLRYDPASGQIADLGTVAGGANELTGGVAMALDAAGGLRIAGIARNFNTENRDFLTLRFPGFDPTLFADGFETGDTGGWTLSVP